MSADDGEGVWVFSYGTLQSERVLQAVLGRVPSSTRATLAGFSRHSLAGRCYPGVCRSPSASVAGRVLLRVTPDELATMDRYEGDEYEALVVGGVTLQTGEVGRARVWAMKESEGVLEEGWSFDKFLQVDERWYVDMCKEWKEEDRVEMRKCTRDERAS